MIPAYIEGKINLKPQDESKATMTKMVKKKMDLLIYIKTLMN